MISRIVSGKPDFVHAVIQRHNTFIRHHFADIADKTFRQNRKPVVIFRFPPVIDIGIVHIFIKIQLPAGLRGDLFFDLPDTVSDVADNFCLREVHRVNSGRLKINMNNFLSVVVHKKRRLLNHIMTHIDNEISTADGTVDKVTVG